MPSDSVSSFLDQARANHFIPPDELDRLLHRTDVPQENLSAVCDYLLSRGVLTQFQADRVRAGRAAELAYAGYPVVDELGPCPGGTAYQVLHPSLRTPLVLRRLRPEWVGPTDTVAAYIQRAKGACPVVHPGLSHLLDAGVDRDEPYVVLEPPDGADLQTLVSDIGPMPTSLVVAYGTQVAEALRAAHERGVVHGEVRPGLVFIAPLAPMTKTRPDGSSRVRPAPDAVAKLGELGLVPRRPPVREWDAPRDVRPYLAPERLDAADPTPDGDLYGLGATVYFLMTAQHPNPTGVLPPLDAVREDAPATLVRLVHSLLSTDPTDRPDADTAAKLFASVLEPPPAPLAAAADNNGPPAPGEEEAVLRAEPPAAWVAVPVDEATPLNAPVYSPAEYTEPESWSPLDEPEGWVPPPDDSQEEAIRAAARAAREDESRGNRVLLVVLGAGFHLLAVLGLIYYFTNAAGCSDTSDQPSAKSTAKQKK